jgi:HK97 family phage prohead protease
VTLTSERRSTPLVANVKRADVLRGLGVVEAVVSVFGVRDRTGDIVQPGAFRKSIAAWKARGTWPPVLWQHSNKAGDVIGRVTAMHESGEGLHVSMQLAIDDNDNARMVLARLREKALTQLSFGYHIGKSHPAADGSSLLLDELDVTEVSAVVAGANPETRTVGVKAASSSLDRANARIAALRDGTKSSPVARLSSQALIEKTRRMCIEAGVWEEPAPPPPAPSFNRTSDSCRHPVCRSAE